MLGIRWSTAWVGITMLAALAPADLAAQWGRVRVQPPVVVRNAPPPTVRARWEGARFTRDPVRLGTRPLDHRGLRQLLDRRTWDRIRESAPGGTNRLWGQVKRFGPGGRTVTLEVWSGDRFVAALTDFDRDGWIDDVVLTRRYRR